MRKATIIGTGLYVLENVIKNEYFDQLYNKDISNFLVEKRGISERRWMSKSQRTSDLILPAAEEALKNIKIAVRNQKLKKGDLCVMPQG